MPVECLEVRERLAEHSVSTLSARDQQEMERHLEWCAGCRKESRELREAASLVGLSLPPAEPPAELEDSVVRRVRGAAAKGVPSGRRLRALRGVTLFAAVVGLVALGLAGALFATQQSQENKLATSEQQAQRFAARFQGLLNDLRAHGAQPQNIGRAVLAPSASRQGGGGALRVTSPRFEDIAVVLVGGLPQRDAPYRAWLLTPSGRRLFVGAIHTLDSGGGGKTTNEFPADLQLYRYVQVRDAKGRVVLSGAFGA